MHCVKTDFGERIPTEDVVWHEGEERTVTVHAADGAVAARVRVRRDGGVVRATVDQGVQALGAWRLRWVTGAWGTAERGREVVADPGADELVLPIG